MGHTSGNAPSSSVSRSSKSASVSSSNKSSTASSSSSVSAGSSYGGFGKAPSATITSNVSSSPSISSKVSSSGSISSGTSSNTGLAAFGLGSLQTGLVSTTNQLGQGFQVSNQSGVAATAARLGNVLSSFIGPVNPTQQTVLTIPTVLTPQQALIPDRPPVGPQPFTVIDLTPDSKTTAGDIPQDSQDIPTTLTQNIIKYTPYLILAGIIYAGISLVKK